MANFLSGQAGQLFTKAFKAFRLARSWAAQGRIRAAAHAGCTLHELIALSGHKSPHQLQEYLEEIEQQKFMADSAIDKVIAAQAKTGTLE